jgi:hypothetical protein
MKPGSDAKRIQGANVERDLAMVSYVASRRRKLGDSSAIISRTFDYG